MILYRGELMEDSRQEELLASLETDLYAPLRRGDRLEQETVIRAFDDLARRGSSTGSSALCWRPSASGTTSSGRWPVFSAGRGWNGNAPWN